MNIRIRIK